MGFIYYTGGQYPALGAKMDFRGSPARFLKPAPVDLVSALDV
jgi:hypothetical protein